MEPNKLIEIANEIGMKNVAESLADIQRRTTQANAPLILPLVGEFSSGKTTLINALTDSKKLETAIAPTTATIYKIFFGQPSVRAEVYKDDAVTQVDDLSQLKNNGLLDADVVCVYDTSKQVAPTTVLVDTPGLSSAEPKHRENLVSFLPYADAILMVTDVNQQITKSMEDFIKDTALSKRPIYLVITQCDTKAKGELAGIVNYIKQNSKLPIEQIACVSAQTGDLQELYDMLAKIDRDKKEILQRVDGQRVRNYAQLMTARIDELLSATEESDGLDKKIQAQERELERLRRNIASLVDDVQSDIHTVENDICHSFTETMYAKLEQLVATASGDLDTQAVSAVNIAASQYLNEYKNQIQSRLLNLANERRGEENGVELESLASLDLSGLNIGALHYNMNLNEVGHQHDKLIAGIAKAVMVGGAVAATIATAGLAAPIALGAGGIAAGGGLLSGAGEAIAVGASVIAGGVATGIGNKKKINSLSKAAEASAKVADAVGTMGASAGKIADSVDAVTTRFGNRYGVKRGFVERIVAKITDKTGKPQRRVLINDYIDGVLRPSFTAEMKRVGNELLLNVRSALNEEAKDTIAQKKSVLEALKAQHEQQHEAFNTRIATLKGYKTALA